MRYVPPARAVTVLEPRAAGLLALLIMLLRPGRRR